MLDGDVTLELERIHRLYLNGYVGKLATSGGLYMFMSEHLGKPVPSPVVLAQITQRFVEELKSYPEQNDIPVIQFQRASGKTTVPIACGNRGRSGTKLCSLVWRRKRRRRS